MKVVAQVLCLSGSLRGMSSSGPALEAAYRLAPSTLELLLYRGLAELPVFSPDAERDPVPEAVAELREAVASADVLLIACTEEAHGLPGAFRNLLEWLVGVADFQDKPVLLLDTAAGGSPHAQQALAEILSTMSARLLTAQPLPVALPDAGCSVTQVLESAERCAELRVALQVLIEAFPAS
jgi:chromate reductase